MLEKMKHLEPNMSFAMKSMALLFYQELKESSVSRASISLNSSTGFIDGLKISDEISIGGSEVSIA